MGASIVPVHPATQLIGSHHEDPAHCPTAQVLGGGDNGEQKAAAGSGEIKGHGIGGSKASLQAWRRTEQVVWGGGGQHNQIEAVGRPTGHLQSPFCR